VVDVINVSPSKALGGDTPYERLFGNKPDLSNLRAWGTLVIMFKPKKLRATKLENPGTPGLFMGYPAHSIGYRILCLTTGRIVEWRDVRFFEHLTVDYGYVHVGESGEEAYARCAKGCASC
jgi:hypothetical protein